MSDNNIFLILATEWTKVSMVFIMIEFQNVDCKCAISYAVVLILLVIMSAANESKEIINLKLLEHEADH